MKKFLVTYQKIVPAQPNTAYQQQPMMQVIAESKVMSASEIVDLCNKDKVAVILCIVLEDK